VIGDEEHFFISESVRHRKALSYPDALKYLRGMLRTCGDLEELGDVRRLVSSMTANDAQLELIESGQLILDLQNGSNPARRRKMGGRKS
jgi:hypothetical protein